MTVISTNSAALQAQNSSRLANQALETAMARLSSGSRINVASDDAAGLAISNSMQSQITGMSQAISNANDGISLAQTADGTLSDVTNNLQRIRELAVQSASGTYSDSDRTNMQTEVTQLTAQIKNALSTSRFNSVPLFDTMGLGTWTGPGTTNTATLPASGSNGLATTIQTGAGAGQTVDIDTPDIPTTLDVNSGDTGILGNALPSLPTPTGTHVVTTDDFLSGATVGGAAVTYADIGTTKSQTAGDRYFEADATPIRGRELPDKTIDLSDALSVSNVTQANATLNLADAYLSAVSSARAGLGASESQLNSVVNNLTNGVTNLTQAKSQISDTDFSSETTALAKAQILSQASTAMLAQANQTTQGVLKLLQQ